MQPTESPNTEAAIVGRLLGPDRPPLTPAAARAILAVDFHERDRERMDELAARARAGTLTPEDRQEIDAYSRVGSLLSVLKSRARKALKESRANGKAR